MLKKDNIVTVVFAFIIVAMFATIGILLFLAYKNGYFGPTEYTDSVTAQPVINGGTGAGDDSAPGPSGVDDTGEANPLQNDTSVTEHTNDAAATIAPAAETPSVETEPITYQDIRNAEQTQEVQTSKNMDESGINEQNHEVTGNAEETVESPAADSSETSQGDDETENTDGEWADEEFWKEYDRTHPNGPDGPIVP